MKKILLDCGSHYGESIDKFKTILPDYNEYEVHMFEPNPYLFEKINTNKNYDKCNKHNVAVSNVDSIMQFFGCQYTKDSVGATLLQEKRIVDRLRPDDFVDVSVIDLSSFISKNFKIDDHIILKLDVEGSEYDILEKLFKDGTIRYINRFCCEFHSRWIGNIDNKYYERERNILNMLKNINLPYEYWDALNV